jgi:hypothetical protein
LIIVLFSDPFEGSSRGLSLCGRSLTFYERPLRVVSEPIIWENTSSGVLDSRDFLDEGLVPYDFY